MSLTRVLRQDIAPVGSAYLVFLIVFIWYAARRRSGTLPGQRSAAITAEVRWTAFLRLLVLMMAGAYLVFALIIAIFYLVLGGQPRNFVPQSLAQGAVLAFGIVLPAFLLLTAAESAWRRHRSSGRVG